MLIVYLDPDRPKRKSSVALCGLTSPQSHLKIRNARGTTIFVLCHRHHPKIPPIPSPATRHQVLGLLGLLTPRSKVGMSGFSVHRRRHRHRHLRHLFTRATLRLDQKMLKGCLGFLYKILWALSNPSHT
jgi:hypothetical protein